MDKPKVLLAYHTLIQILNKYLDETSAEFFALLELPDYQRIIEEQEIISQCQQIIAHNPKVSMLSAGDGEVYSWV